MESKTENLYGDALFELAEEGGIERVNSLKQEMELIHALFREEPDFLKLLSSPAIPVSARFQVLDNVFQTELSKEFLHFLKVLIQKDRISLYSAIYHYFLKRYHTVYGVAEVIVTSAKPISPSLKEKIMKKMVEVTGKQVQIIEKTDPNLLGGIVVDIGSNRFDGSLRTQLETLKRDITNA